MLAHGLDVRYNQRVDHIAWGGTTGVVVTCADGAALHADAVIVSVSLGVLKVSQSLNI